MISKLTTGEKVVGLKQTRRMVAAGKATMVFLAYDADPFLTGPVMEECSSKGIPVETGISMMQLGKACQISVGTAAAAKLM